LFSTYFVGMAVLALVLAGDTPAFAAGFEERITPMTGIAGCCSAARRLRGDSTEHDSAATE
jgi:hypothetical protein